VNSPLVEGSTSVAVSLDGHHVIVAVVTQATSNIKLRTCCRRKKHLFFVRCIHDRRIFI